VGDEAYDHQTQALLKPEQFRVVATISTLPDSYLIRDIKMATEEDTWATSIKKDVATPLWPSVGVKPNTPKVGDLESSGTPKCLEFDNKAQNTSH